MGRLTVAVAVCWAGLCTQPPIVAGQAAASATGTIVGVVLDAGSGDPIIEAGVEVIGTGTKTRTDLDGKYRVKATPGTYELRVFAPLYQGARLRGVVVAENQETTANASLKPEGDAAVEVVEVVAEARQAAEATQLLQRQAAPVVSDNIGAEEVRKTPDSSAAEIVQRLPSITVSEDDFVFVRGLNERYTLGVLSGSRLPSTDPDKRVVPLNVFPAVFVESIDILKTYQASMPGDAAAGLIDINLKDPPDRLTYGIGLSVSANTQATFKSFDSYKGGRYDYFGFGKDYRTPNDLPNTLETGTGQQGGARQREMAGRFRNIWNLDSDAAPPDFDLNFNIGNAWGPVSFALAGKYKNEHERRSKEIVGDTVNQSEDNCCNQFEYRRSEFDTELSGVLTGAWKISPNHKINLRSFVFHYSSDEVANGESIVTENFQDSKTLFPTFIEYEEGKLGVGQLTGGHHFEWLDVDWRTSLAETTRELPDRRFYQYDQENLGDTGLPDPSQPRLLNTKPPSLLREFDNLDEWASDSAIDVSVPFPIWSDLRATFQTGVAYSYRSRNYSLRRFQYESRTDFTTTADPESALVPQNIGTNFRFDERTLPSDSFEASQQIAAYYGQFEVPIIRDRLRLIAGARLEYSYIFSKGAFTSVIGGDPEFEIPINDLDALPAVNLVYSPLKDMNVRLGFSQNVSRPEFRELQPTLQFRPLGERPVQGNPLLVSAFIDSYDLRWEWFFGDRELVSVGGFYKDLKDPIEKTTKKFGTFNADSFVNADSAMLYGFEVEGRKNFGMLAPLFRRSPRTEGITPYLQNLRLIANVSYIESEAEVTELGESNSRSRPLQGQPSFVVNAALEYDQLDFLTTRLSYYTFGERLDSVGIPVENIPDTFEQRRDQLDFVILKPFTVYDTPLNAKFSVENILNDQFLKLQDDFVARRYTTGVKFTVGMAYVF